LKIRNEEVENQGKKMEMLQKEAAEGKALQENLTVMSAMLSEREREMKTCQEQMRILENQKEIHKTSLNQVIKDIREKEQMIESQQEQIQELKKQQEKQSIALSKMSNELEQREKQEIRSQQELIGELEKQLELQSTAVSKMSKELEDKHLEIKFQEEKIMVLEQHGASQVRNLLVDLHHMKGNLKEKNLELLSLTEQIQELEKEREQGKSLHTSLEHVRAALTDRENECDTLRGELKLLQQHKEQQERHLQELLDNVENMTLSLSRKDEELESQQKQIQQVEEVMEMQLRTVRDQLEQTLATLEDKDRLIDMQKQQTRSSEEKREEQISVLHRELEYTRAVLKEKDFLIESQKEVIENFRKQKQVSEEQKEILQHLQADLKEKEQEVVSLRNQCEACKDKEEKHEAEQTNSQAATLTVKGRQEKTWVQEEAIPKLQQQKEETVVQPNGIVQKLEYAEPSVEARDQERESLQEHVQDFQEQEEEGRQAKRLAQDQDKMRQMLQENCLEFHEQTQQMNMFQLQEESMRVALTSSQKQVTLLEEVLRRKDEDMETLLQKLQRQEEELKTWQNLQPRPSEKNEEVRHGGEQEKLLEKAFPERGESKAQSEQNELEKEIRALQKDLQHVHQTLTKKDEEIKYQTDRVKNLEKTRDHLLQRQKELTQQWQAERKASGEELERVTAVLKQREITELKWKEKAQLLSAALTKSKEELAILQKMVAERDTDRFHQQ
ncbi:CP250 protein, partial [Sapayoa aenigma]|nr:CP250 protein [Sapayoa aenigma]